MMSRLQRLLRRWRRRVSRSEWAIRALGLSRAAPGPAEPGLLLIQIDGLGRDQFDAALAAGRLPFLRRLLRREGYVLHDLYAGVPSTTPAVQAEMFYGVHAAVPAFSFLDPDSGEAVRMYEPAAARALEAKLAAAHEPLLAGGAAYGNIFTGGAHEDEAHFCVAALGVGPVLRAANPLTIALLVLGNLASVARVVGLLVAELGLALHDFVRGWGRDFHLLNELKFIPTRVAICIGLRELISIGAQIDIARGLPVIQLNFAGYDEQSHRRGPDAEFAHWALKGIDRSIARLWRMAMRSERRDYRVWIYSDHGQARVVPYPLRHGRSVADALDEILARPSAMPTTTVDARRGVQSQRALTLRGAGLPRLLPVYATSLPPPGSASVADMGPIGHVRLPADTAPAVLADVARRLVHEAGVPLALICDGSDAARAWTRAGEWRLPEDGHAVIGESHRFRDEVVADLVALCHHPQAGHIVIAGWCAGSEAFSFAIENGAHGGFGPQETNGFALLDADAPLPVRRYAHVRAADVRAAALVALGRAEAVRPATRAHAPSLRVMSYNVHACRGMDGVTSASRIARVIGQAAPDIVALQELDVGRARSNHADQAHQLALALAMSREFHAALAVREELYGDAVLTALPMRLVRSGWLPGSPRREPRGALWVSIDVDGVAWQIINTHLGLRVGERAAQIDHLLGDGWLEAALRAGPVVFLGDLNAGEGSYVCRRLADRLTDVQRAIPGWRPRATWFGQRPTLRLDHIYVSSDIAVDAVTVVDSALARRASDHLPIVASLRLREARPTDLSDCNVYSADGPTITRTAPLTTQALDSRPDQLRP